MNDKIREALSKLDVANEDHWTAEGLPRLDVMKDLVGTPVSRSDITAAAKGFTRKTPNLEIEKPEFTGTGEQADPEVEQEQGDNTETTEVEAIESGSDEAVQAELDAATVALHEAQVRYNKAQEAMDVVIKRRAEKQSQRTTAMDIKAYQKSQHEQRLKALVQQQRLIEAARTLEK